MRENRMSGSMSGDWKRGSHQGLTAPVLDSTSRLWLGCEHRLDIGRAEGDLSETNFHDPRLEINLKSCPATILNGIRLPICLTGGAVLKNFGRGQVLNVAASHRAASSL